MFVKQKNYKLDLITSTSHFCVLVSEYFSIQRSKRTQWFPKKWSDTSLIAVGAANLLTRTVFVFLTEIFPVSLLTVVGPAFKQSSWTPKNML